MLFQIAKEKTEKTAEKHYVGRNENEASDNRWSAGEAVTVISGCPRNGIREEREAEGGCEGLIIRLSQVLTGRTP